MFGKTPIELTALAFPIDLAKVSSFNSFLKYLIIKLPSESIKSEVSSLV